MYELLRKSTCSGSSYIRQFTPTPSPQAITYGLRVQQVKANSCRCTVYAHFWWSRHSTVKHPLSVSQYFPSSFKKKLSVTGYNLSQIANSKYIICIKQANRYSTCRKSRFLRLQKLTIRVVERLKQIYGFWPVSNLKIIQNEGDWEPFSQKNNRGNNGGKNQNPKKSLGLQTKQKKNLCAKI